MARVGAIVVGCLLLLVPLVLAAVGVGQAWEQHEKNTAWVAVPATVQTVDIDRVRGSKGSVSYRPVVTFSYLVNGASYTSRELYPTNESGSWNYANAAVLPFNVGMAVTAYRHPADPGRAFLVKRTAFAPYLFVVIAAATGAVLSVIAVSMMFPGPSGFGEGTHAPFRLMPESRLSQRVNRRWLACTIAGLGFAPIAHYFSAADKPEALAWWVTGIYSGLCLVPLGMLVHALAVSRRVDDAVVEVSLSLGLLGHPLGVRVSLPLRKQTAGTLEAALVLRRSLTTGSGKGKKTQVTDDLVLPAPTVELAGVTPGTAAVSDLVAMIPAGAEPTSSKANANPKYDWRIIVRARVAGGADYQAVFPIVVQSPAGPG